MHHFNLLLIGHLFKLFHFLFVANKGGAKNATETNGQAVKKPTDAGNKGAQTNIPPNPPFGKPSNQYLSGMFRLGGGSGGGGSGKSFEGGDKDKWIIAGIVGAVGIIGSMVFFDVNSKEITWREFAYR